MNLDIIMHVDTGLFPTKKTSPFFIFPFTWVVFNYLVSNLYETFLCVIL
jgi:hypothetical protein